MSLHLVPRSLLYIECVAQLGSIQKASRELGIAASAIYRQIKAAEEIAGTPLFERSPSGMKPNQTGEFYIRLARDWRDDSARLWSNIKEMQGIEFGHVRMAAMDSMVNGFLPEFLTALTRDYPHVQIELEVLSPDQAVMAVLEGACDIALAFNVKPQSDLAVLWSAKLPLGYVASPDHAIAGKNSMSLSEALQYPIVLQSRALSVRRYLEKHHNWLFLQEPQAIITNSLQLLKKMAVAGRHIALTSEFDAAPELMAGELVFVPVSDKDAAPQSISVISNALRQPTRVSQKITSLLCSDAERYLKSVRDKAKR